MRGSSSQYFTFCTPECTSYIDVYLEFRTKNGENLNKDSYIIRDQFDITDLEQIRNKSKGLSISGIESLLNVLLLKSGVRPMNHNRDRKEIARAHGFRKFFTTQLINSKVNPEIREMLLGHKIGLVDKSQKSGLTTSELIHDFQECLINGKDKDLLIVGQTAKHAEEHLYTLKRLIIESEKYRKYLITKSSELYFREEQTKVRTLYLKNPDNPYRPMRIIGLPFTVSSIWSWKNVFRIHISDPAAAPIVDDAPVYAAAFSRLTNTDGRLMIEGPPAGPFGRFYELHEQFKDNKNPDFQVFHVTIYDARDNGLVTQKFIDEKKIELGPLFATTYLASFEIGVGNVFDSQAIDKAVELGKKYSVEKIPIHAENPKVYGCDFGFSSSATSIIGFEHMRNQLREGTIKEDIIRVIDLHYIQRGNPQEISDLCWNIWQQNGYMNTWYYCDSSSAAMVNLLKGRWNENVNWLKTKDVSPRSNKIIPISFNGDSHKQMLSRFHLIVSKGKLAIDPKYDKLITSMRTAVAEGLSLQKEKTSFDDVFDSARVGLVPFELN